MRTSALLPLVFLVGVSTTPGQFNTQTSSDPSMGAQSGAAPDPPAADDPPDLLFPVATLNGSLPSWLRIGGQYRNRLEGPIGIGYTRTRQFYLLDRLPAPGRLPPKDC